VLWLRFLSSTRKIFFDLFFFDQGSDKIKKPEISNCAARIDDDELYSFGDI